MSTWWNAGPGELFSDHDHDSRWPQSEPTVCCSRCRQDIWRGSVTTPDGTFCFECYRAYEEPKMLQGVPVRVK